MNGFVSDADKHRMSRFHAGDWDKRNEITFGDARLTDFAARILLRLHPGLSPSHEDALRELCGRALHRPTDAREDRWPTVERFASEAAERWRDWAAQQFGEAAWPDAQVR